MPSFRRKDIGMAYGFEATAKTEDKLMKKIAEHARTAHGMQTLTADVMRKIRKAIKE